MSIEKNIIAIGGGGFGRITKEKKIERYILSLSNKDTSKPSFLHLNAAASPPKPPPITTTFLLKIVKIYEF